MCRFLLLALVLGLGGLMPPARLAAADPHKTFAFQPGDRVVFLGDSITEQYQYSTYLELYLTTRFPTAKMTFLNAGIGGDTAAGGANRFKDHVLAEKPTVVVINFGMNDGGYGAFDPARQKAFLEKTEAMLKMAKVAGVRAVLLSPNAVDRRNKSNGKQYLETQKRFYAPLKELAARYGVPFADVYARTRLAQEQMERDDPKAEKAVPYYDGFHTSPPGGYLMATAALYQISAYHQVSTVYLRTPNQVKLAASAGCKVEDLTGDWHGVSFTRADEAIPMPMQKDWEPMWPYKDGAGMNQYILSVQGMSTGTYALTCDGVEVGRYTAEELGEVDLGRLTAGPVWEQGQKVLAAINKKNELVRQRFGVRRFNAPDWLADVTAERRPAELDKRMAAIDKAQAAVYELARPKPHTWEVKAVK